MNAAAPTAKPASRVSGPIQRGIVPILQQQQEKQTEAEISDENEDPEYKRKKGEEEVEKSPYKTIQRLYSFTFEQ